VRPRAANARPRRPPLTRNPADPRRPSLTRDASGVALIAIVDGRGAAVTGAIDARVSDAEPPACTVSCQWARSTTGPSLGRRWGLLNFPPAMAPVSARGTDQPDLPRGRPHDDGTRHSEDVSAGVPLAATTSPRSREVATKPRGIPPPPNSSCGYPATPQPAVLRSRWTPTSLSARSVRSCRVAGLSRFQDVIGRRVEMPRCTRRARRYESLAALARG
jgi:hypothetical protein